MGPSGPHKRVFMYKGSIFGIRSECICF